MNCALESFEFETRTVFSDLFSFLGKMCEKVVNDVFKRAFCLLHRSLFKRYVNNHLCLVLHFGREFYFVLVFIANLFEVA